MPNFIGPTVIAPGVVHFLWHFCSHENFQVSIFFGDTYLSRRGGTDPSRGGVGTDLPRRGEYGLLSQGGVGYDLLSLRSRRDPRERERGSVNNPKKNIQ